MKKTHKPRRKALAATLGAVILFAMLFTTGAAYFLFITTQQQGLNNQLLTASATQNDRLSERYTLVSFTCFTSDAQHTGCAAAGKIGINITNSSPVAIKIIVIIVSSSSTVSVRDGQSGSQTTPNVPFTINPGTSKNYIDTGVTPTSGVTYTLGSPSPHQPRCRRYSDEFRQLQMGHAE
ncbi:MAG: hypothetical protein HYY67_05035 [Thaumarchaeota archaeon]|nr:hypothetical protein [Nitrososphaerota archaeon]